MLDFAEILANLYEVMLSMSTFLQVGGSFGVHVEGLGRHVSPGPQMEMLGPIGWHLAN